MSRFVPTPGVEQILASQRTMLAALAVPTSRVETEAKRLAGPISSRFEDGIDSAVGIDEQGPVGRVNAHWWGSLFVEFGTATQPPRAILRQALDSTRGVR